MSKHDEIAAIVEKYCGELADCDLTYNNKRYWVFYSYKTFPANKKSNLLKLIISQKMNHQYSSEHHQYQ